jgi:hypothetical protein
MNEVAGVIAQVLKVKDADHMALLHTIMTDAETHGHLMSMKRFLHCCDLTAEQKLLLAG